MFICLSMKAVWHVFCRIRNSATCITLLLLHCYPWFSFYLDHVVVTGIWTIYFAWFLVCSSLRSNAPMLYRVYIKAGWWSITLPVSVINIEPPRSTMHSKGRICSTFKLTWSKTYRHWHFDQYICRMAQFMLLYHYSVLHAELYHGA